MTGRSSDMTYAISKDLVEKARQLGADECKVIDLLIAEESAFRHVRSGCFAVNLAEVQRQLHWGRKRVIAALTNIRTFLT